MGMIHFIKKLPERGFDTSYYYFREWALRQLPISDFGKSVYQREWDVLIVLDACRVDLFEEVADDYDWLPSSSNIHQERSIAGSSKEWMERTFYEQRSDHEKRIRNTAYVTGNPFSSHVFGTGEDGVSDATEYPIALLDEVWRYAWDNEVGTIRPEPLTDRAIQVGREHDGPLIVHYMQPHIPFLSAPEMHGGFDTETWGTPESARDSEPNLSDIWNRLREGEVNHDEVWTAYRKNLRIVLDDVDRLRQNIDADTTVLTADHGNAVGEKGVYGHPDLSIDPIVQVPWVTVEAEDTRSDDPTFEACVESDTDETVSDRLSALGYVEE